MESYNKKNNIEIKVVFINPNAEDMSTALGRLFGQTIVNNKKNAEIVKN